MNTSTMTKARLSPHEQATLSAFVEAVRGVTGARFVGATLFGSRARGEGDEASDLDVLVWIKGASPADRRAIVDVAAGLSEHSGLSLSPLVRAPGALAPTSSLARALATDGVPL
jgi:predicted nucleotidyltransferase